MSPRALPSSAVASLVITLVAALVGGTLVGSIAGPARAAENTRSDVTIVTANILTGMPVAKFQSDVREVLAPRPDFVTYNEVPYRQDSVLAPDGYDIYRSTRNRYTAEAPVVWRSDRWTPVATGTFRISNVRTIPDGKHTKLGLRFANWATLQSVDGRQASVVAVHIAPLFKIDGRQVDLLRPSVQRLGTLVEQLAPSGPVLVGGDFNVHYKSGRYPRDLLDAAGLVPTFDTLGAYFPTGDHHGATIDYVFNRGADTLLAEQQRPIELYSDHDAVVAGLGWQVDAPEDRVVVTSDPDGSPWSRRAALRTIWRTIASTTAGDTVEVVTPRFDQRGLFRALRAAIEERGVHVRLTVLHEDLTYQERRLVRVVRASGDRASRVRRCLDTCAENWVAGGLPLGFVLATDGSGSPIARLDVNRRLTSVVLTARTTVVSYTGPYALADGQDLLRSVY